MKRSKASCHYSAKGEAMENQKWTRFACAVAVAFCVNVLSPGNAKAAEVWTECKPAEVAVFKNRVHVKCSVAAPGGILFFAVPITAGNAADVDRFVNMASTAITSSRSLSVVFDSTDLSGAAWGCATANCRRPSGYVLH
jgi:hypothetical protein